MGEHDGLLWAYRIDPLGEAVEIGWDQLAEDPGDAYHWIHFDLDAPDVQRWLVEKSGLSELECEVVMADETRPRTTAMRDGLVINLRGVNLNPGADPEDMVAVRLWVDGRRVITIRRRRLIALEDVRAQLSLGGGATSVGELVADVANALFVRAAGVLGDLDEELDDIEESLGSSSNNTRTQLLELRRQAIALRRYLAPQRDALAQLANERVDWLDERDRLHVREALDRTTRLVEDLEAARERAAVAQEEIANRLAEELNSRMYALSIIAGIFLPLSFATGLLGINVAGIPGSETPWAFAAVCGGLALIGVVELFLFRRLRWL